MVGSLTGAVSSQIVTEEYEGTLGTVVIQLKLSGFSWKHGITHLAPLRVLRYHVSTYPPGFA